MTFLRSLDRWLVGAIVAGLILGISSGLAAPVSGSSDDGSDGYNASRRLLVVIDNAQLCYREETGHYTSNLANLEEVQAVVGPASLFQLPLEVKGAGDAYRARILGEPIRHEIARRGTALVADTTASNPGRGEKCRPEGV